MTLEKSLQRLTVATYQYYKGSLTIHFIRPGLVRSWEIWRLYEYFVNHQVEDINQRRKTMYRAASRHRAGSSILSVDGQEREGKVSNE
jgi:hypothetical protein